MIFGIIFGIVFAGTVVAMVLTNVPTEVISAVAFIIFGVAFIVIALRLVSAILSYRTNGIAVENEKITVYSGGFAKNVTVFKSRNLIAVESVTTPLRKKRGIASVVMHLKTNEQSNEIKVHIQKDTLSDELQKMLRL